MRLSDTSSADNLSRPAGPGHQPRGVGFDGRASLSCPLALAASDGAGRSGKGNVLIAGVRGGAIICGASAAVEFHVSIKPRQRGAGDTDLSAPGWDPAGDRDGLRAR